MAPDAAAVVVASHGRDEEATLPPASTPTCRTSDSSPAASGRGGDRRRSACDAVDAARIHSPAGLDIGARTPAEIALSIMSEIVSLPAAPVGRGRVAETRHRDGTAIDPVCGMTVATVDSSLHLDHDDATRVVLREWLPARLRRRPARVRRSMRESVVTTVAALLPDVECRRSRAASRLAPGYLPDAGPVDGAVLRRPAPAADPARGRGRRRQDGGGQVAGRGARHAARAAPVLRGDRRRRGAVRVELHAPAAGDPARRVAARRARRRRHVHRGVPRRAADPARAAPSRAAPGGAAGRRDRPRRRRVRGVPARGAGGVVGDDPRARHAAAPTTRRSSC